MTSIMSINLHKKENLFDISDLAGHIYGFLSFEDIYNLSTTSKTFYEACKKTLVNKRLESLVERPINTSIFYKDIFKFICNKCFELPKKMCADYYTTTDSIKQSYKKKIKKVIKQYGEFRCNSCRTYCLRCTMFKNEIDLIREYDEDSLIYGFTVCKYGCKKKCSSCKTEIGRKDTMIMPSSGGLIYYRNRPWLDPLSDKYYQDVYLDQIVNGFKNDVVCDRCYRRV